jgi:ubiquinol oxidase
MMLFDWYTKSMPENNSIIFSHHKPENISDCIAFILVRVSRIIADVFFAKRYGPRAVVLETVAAVPGMVGALFLHLKCLRRIRNDHGFIRQLQEEAENERMHLMAYVLLAQPSWIERLLVIIAQGIFFFGYALVYFFSPRTGHRVVGYLEEEAVHSYTLFLQEIDAGRHDNPPAPDFAKEYWKLPADAKVRDMVIATVADEVRHRDANHLLVSEIEKI